MLRTLQEEHVHPATPRAYRVRPRSVNGVTGVLLVADHRLDRCGLRAILEVQPDLEVVGEAGDCGEAPTLEQAQRLGADVVLLHVQEQRVNPLATIRELVRSADDQATRVLALMSPGSHSIDETEALRAGASGVLSKDCSPRELVAALRIVAAGYTILTPFVVNELVQRGSAQRVAPCEPPAEFSQLTAREQQVFRLIALGCSTTEIASRLVVGENTIKSHTQHLFAKLNLRNRVHTVIYAYENGLTPTGRRQQLPALCRV